MSILRYILVLVKALYLVLYLIATGNIKIAVSARIQRHVGRAVHSVPPILHMCLNGEGRGKQAERAGELVRLSQSHFDCQPS